MQTTLVVPCLTPHSEVVFIQSLQTSTSKHFHYLFTHLLFKDASQLSKPEALTLYNLSYVLFPLLPRSFTCKTVKIRQIRLEKTYTFNMWRTIAACCFNRNIIVFLKVNASIASWKKLSESRKKVFYLLDELISTITLCCVDPLLTVPGVHLGEEALTSHLHQTCHTNGYFHHGQIYQSHSYHSRYLFHALHT